MSVQHGYHFSYVSLCFSVSGLCPYNMYAFSVFAYNSKGKSHESRVVHERTSGEQLALVRDLKVNLISANDVRVTWSKPTKSSKVRQEKRNQEPVLLYKRRENQF